MDITKELARIDSSRECLEFIGERIKLENYRGTHISQHNRYTREQVIGMLKIMYDLVKDKKIQLRTTDLKNLSKDPLGEKIYNEYAKLVERKFKKGTRDSIRKNYFLDFHRMGLINRYDKNKELLLPLPKKQFAQYVSLSKLSLNLVNPQTPEKDINISFSNCLSRFLNNIPEDIQFLLNETGSKKITSHEYMFFISFIGLELNRKTYSNTDILDLLKDWRSMDIGSQNLAIIKLKEYANPKIFKGNKNDKKDFSNWHNEAQQTFSILGMHRYFESYNKNKTLQIRFTGSEDEKTWNRSDSEKKKYFKNHNFEKTGGYQLHHIYPCNMAGDLEQHNEIDCWENMILIDGGKHDILSRNNNSRRFIRLEIHENGDVSFLEMGSNNTDSVKCKYNEDVLYSLAHKDIMLRKNESLLKLKTVY